MATLKQTIANRLNALKSTGPRTAEGKARSSRNATTHGLSRLPSLPSGGMAEAIAGRMTRWKSTYRPEGPAQDWLFERLCAESARLDSCERRILVARAEQADRAAESWDDDRAAEVAQLASRLPDRPELVQPRLLQSRHGVLWLIERWGDVAADLERCDGWAPENWFLALDLLGVPVDGRKHSGPWDLDPNDNTAGPGLELVRRGVEALQHRLDAFLDDRDARARDDAQLGFGEETPELRRLERYAADARRRVAWCLVELRRLQGEGAPARSSAGGSPARVASPAPPPPPRPDRRPGAMPPNEAPDPTPSSASAAVRDALRPVATAPVGSSPTAARGRLAPEPRPNRRARRALAAAARRS